MYKIYLALIALCFVPLQMLGEEAARQPETDTLDYKIYTSYEDFEKEILHSDPSQTVLVNFWATWCAPCVKELPYFEALNAEDENIRVVLVSLDFVEQIEKRFKPFVIKKQLRSELVILDDMDANKWIDMVDPSWSGTIPATLLVKGNSKFFTAKEFESKEEIKDFIQQLNK